MNDAITAASLRWGVSETAIRVALGLGDVRVVAEIMGVPAKDVERRVALLAGQGISRTQALGFALLAV